MKRSEEEKIWRQKRKEDRKKPKKVTTTTTPNPDLSEQQARSGSIKNVFFLDLDHGKFGSTLR